MNAGLAVLEFTKIQFIGKWNRSGGDPAKAIYIAGEQNDANLKVVWQSVTGNLKTYLFTVPVRNQVWVNWAENLVHVPVNCSKELQGDITKCE